jgi:homocysteine S-methyltransferase
MAKYRNALPQLDGGCFLTDGGIETTLIFAEGHELPHFAAFHLLKTADGVSALRRYFRTYAELAVRFGAGLVLETPTWRASQDWAWLIGCSTGELVEANRASVAHLQEVRDQFETPETPIVISGCVGPRGDGYVPGSQMSVEQAANYHRLQVETFAEAGADLATGITMNYVEEAIGLTRAAQRARMPVVISLTVETDGLLPTGQALGSAIQEVDDSTFGYPAYYMLNCAHTSHFERVIRGDEPWAARIRGLRANASRMSHVELNEAPELDAGNPEELGRDYAALLAQQLRYANVLGGCCGTDHRHVEQIAAACLPMFQEEAAAGSW